MDYIKQSSSPVHFVYISRIVSALEHIGWRKASTRRVCRPIVFITGRKKRTRVSSGSGWYATQTKLYNLRDKLADRHSPPPPPPPSRETSNSVGSCEFSRVAGFARDSPTTVHYEPQSSEFEQQFWDVLNTTDPKVKFIRATVVYGLSLTTVTSAVSFMGVTGQYVESLACPPILLVMRSAFKDMVNSYVSQSSEQETWTEQLRRVIGNWESFKGSKVSLLLQRFFAILVSWGLASAIGLEVDKEKWERIYAKGPPGFLWGADIVSTIVTTLSYAYDNIVDFVKTGNLSSLIGLSKEARDRDVEFSFLVANAAVVERGSCQRELLIPETEYEVRLMKAIDGARDYVTGCSIDSSLRANAVSKLLQLEKVMAKLHARWKTKSVREAPYAVVLTGGAGIGKTTVVPMIIKAMFHGAKETYDPRFVKSLNPADKYDQCDHMTRVVTIDDIGQTRSEFVQQAPTEAIIKIINNDNAPMNKADLPDKGTVFWNAFGVVGTSNIVDLDAGVYTRWPAAVMRRFKYHIAVKVKPEYAIAGDDGPNAMLDPAKASGVVADMWEFIFRVSSPTGDKGNVNLIPRIHTFADGTMASSHRVGLEEALRIVSDATAQHRAQQQNYLEKVENMNGQDMCEHGSFRSICTKCPPRDNMGSQSLTSICSYVPPTWLKWGFTTVAYYCGLTHWFIRLFRITSGKVALVVLSAYLFLTYVGLLVLLSWGLGSLLVAFICSILVLACEITVHSRNMKKWWVHKDEAYAAMVQNVSLNARSRLFKGAAALVGVLTSIKLFMICFPPKSTKYADIVGGRSGLASQGTTASSHADGGLPPDVDARPDPWAKPVHVAWSLNDPHMRTVGFDHVVEKVSRQLGMCKLYSDNGKVSYCNVLVVRTNVILITNHSLRWESLQGGIPERASVVFHSESGCGPQMHFSLSEANVHRIGQTDLAVVFTGTGGDKVDLTGYFAAELPKRHGACSELFRSIDDKVVVKDSYVINPAKTSDRTGSYVSYDFDRSSVTFDGLCGATHIMESVTPCIIGLHNAGVTGATKGRGCAITRSQLIQGINNLTQKSIVFRPGTTTDCQGVFEQSSQFPVVPVIHPKSPLRGLDCTSAIVPLGSSMGHRRVNKTNLVVTGISSTLGSLGYPRKHGPPPFHLARELLADTLLQWSSPCIIPMDDLLLAAQDWSDHCIEFIDQNPFLKTQIRPLSIEAAISGCDGVQGIDRVDFSTSTGWPLNMPKRELFEPIPPTRWCQDPYTLKPQYRDYFDNLTEIFASGSRPYVPFSCCFKDEPIPIGKEKLRVFSAVNWAMGLLIRMYYLPVVRVSLLYPTVFESAVGVNAYSPEWGVLVNYACSKGRRRCDYGDYKKYDKMLSETLTGTQLNIWIEIAKRCAYTERELTIMRGLASEMRNPVYEWNADFFMVLGSNASGNNITVQLNGGAGSMLKRAAFYALGRKHGATRHEPDPGVSSYPTEWAELITKRLGRVNLGFEDRLNDKPLLPNLRGRFRHYVSLLTYGDDNVSSASMNIPWYNQRSVAEYLKGCGITYTDAHKGEFQSDYQDHTEFSFLKRGAVWNEDLETLAAPLEVDSIFKSLHLRKSNPDVGDQEHSADMISNAMREFLHHGREVFNTMRIDLSKVVVEHGLSKFFKGGVLPTYDALVADWKEGNTRV